MLHQRKNYFSLFLVTILAVILLASGLLFVAPANAKTSVNISESTQEQSKITNDLQNYSVSGQNFNASFSGGDGSQTNPFRISNANDLDSLSNQVSNGEITYSGKYFILTNNIDLAQFQGDNFWVPIGVEGAIGTPDPNLARPFSGYFDGNGYTISNLTLRKGFAYNGLFGFVKNATIVNLQIRNVQANFAANNKTFIGGVVGYTQNQCRIENVFVSGINIQVTSAYFEHDVYIGGLVGSFYSSGTYFVSCGVENITASTSSSKVKVGGLVGGSSGSSYNIIYFDYCYVLGMEFVAVNSSQIDFRYSFYKIDNTWKYYLATSTTKPIQTVYMLSTFKSGFIDNQTEPQKWVIMGENYVLKGVGNKAFSTGSAQNATINYPNTEQAFSLSATPIIQIAANSDYKLTNIKVYQSLYKDRIYSGNYPSGVDIGYVNMPISGNSYSLEISHIFTDKARQGHFTIDVTSATSSFEATVIEQFYDITNQVSSTPKETNLSTQNLKLSAGQTISTDIITNSSALAIYNNKYLSNIGIANFVISGGGQSGEEQINASTFTLSDTQSARLQNGGTLYINYTNANPVTINKTSAANSSTLTYFMASTNGTLYFKTENIFSFTAVSLSAGSPLISENSNQEIKFLGYSTNAPATPVDYYGRDDSEGNFVGWKPDCTMLINTVMENLSENNANYAITGMKVASFNSWNFDSIPTLNPVWGGNTVRLVTGVYTFVNGVYTPTTFYNIKMNTQVSPNGNFSLTKNSNVTLELCAKESSGAAPLSGFKNIEWFVAEINGNQINELLTPGFGTLSEIANNKTTFSGIQKQSGIIVVLEPKNDITLTNIIVAGCNETDLPTIKFNGALYANNANTPVYCIYGNQYVVILENLTKGWSIDSVTISNGSKANISNENNSFSFVLNSNSNFDISINLGKGVLYNFWIYILIATAILALLICIIVTVIRVSNKNVDLYATAITPLKQDSSFSTTDFSVNNNSSNKKTIKNNSKKTDASLQQSYNKTNGLPEVIHDEESTYAEYQEKNKKAKNKTDRANKGKNSNSKNSKGEVYDFSYDEDYDNK